MVAAALSFGCGTVFAQQGERDAGSPEEKILPEILAITPSDVFVEVSLLRDELEFLRIEMGRPKSDQGEIAVTNAVPREVHFQARTLFDKANTLSYEFLGEHSKPPTYPATKIYPYHVLATVRAALRQILLVKVHLGISQQAEMQLPDPTKRPTEVYRSIVQANRQLNLLLEREYSPTDVFQQVSLALVYVERLLGRFPEGEISHQPPPFERGKFPSDVYRRLIGCFGLIRDLADVSELSILRLEVDTMAAARMNRVTPSDVYDIATLVVSELAFFHSHLKGAEPVVEEFVSFSERKFPSHVYQRVGILEEQLRDLLMRVKEHPDWLQ